MIGARDSRRVAPVTLGSSKDEAASKDNLSARPFVPSSGGSAHGGGSAYHGCLVLGSKGR